MAATLTDKPGRGRAPKPPKEPRAPKPPKAAKPPRPPKPAKAVKPARAPRERVPKDRDRGKPAKTPKAPKGQPGARTEDWGDPVKPALNLLPPKARGARERRKATRGAMLVSAGLVVLAAAGYASLLGAGAVAQGDLERAQATGQAHQAELGRYQQVQDFAAAITDRKKAASAALDQDVAYSTVLSAVSAANTVGASFDTVSTVADLSGCPAPNPFAPSLAVGCLQLSGSAPSPMAVGKLVSALAADPAGVLTSPYATESGTGDKGQTSFKISVGFTDKALSRRGQAFAPAPAAGTSPSASTPAPAGQATAPAPSPAPTKETSK